MTTRPPHASTLSRGVAFAALLGLIALVLLFSGRLSTFLDLPAAVWVLGVTTFATGSAHGLTALPHAGAAAWFGVREEAAPRHAAVLSTAARLTWAAGLT